MAADDQLAQIARHAVRRRRTHWQARRRADRQQVPDPDFRRRRDRSRPAGGRCRPKRHRRVRPYRALLLLRQGRHLRVRLGAAVRHEQPDAECLDDPRRRAGSLERISQGLQLLRHARRQHQRPDGWLVPKADREDGRPEGPEVQARRLCRQDHAARRRHPAADCGRRHLSRAREGHHRRSRMGRPATTTRSSASTRLPSSTTTRAGGSRARA